MKDIFFNKMEGFFEISFNTDWMRYDVFVDEGTLEVVGFDYRPIPMNTLLASLPESAQNAS